MYKKLFLFLLVFSVFSTTPVYAASNVKLNKSSIVMGVGKNVKLTANVKNVRWSSSNSKVATVNQNGTVTAKGVGTCYIMAKTAKCKVTVLANTSIEEKLKASKTAQKADQIILTYGPYKRANGIAYYTTALYNKDSNGNWKKSISTTNSRVGANGLKLNRHTGDKTTPIGSYPLTMAFGRLANPGAKMTYKKLTKYSWWGGEGSSWGKYKNRYYEGKKPGKGGEHLMDYYQYDYAMNIGYNYSPVVKGKGACIFLHCNGKKNTAGCVSVPKNIMKQFVQKCGKNTYIVIVPNTDDILNY